MYSSKDQPRTVPHMGSLFLHVGGLIAVGIILILPAMTATPTTLTFLGFAALSIEVLRRLSPYYKDPRPLVARRYLASLLYSDPDAQVIPGLVMNPDGSVALHVFIGSPWRTAPEHILGVPLRCVVCPGFPPPPVDPFTARDSEGGVGATPFSSRAPRDWRPKRSLLAALGTLGTKPPTHSQTVEFVDDDEIYDTPWQGRAHLGETFPLLPPGSDESIDDPPAPLRLI